MHAFVPKVPFITLRLEIVQYNACWRWHQDAYVGRAIISYVGPGTCTTDDQSVRWTKFDQTVEDDTENEVALHKSMQTNVNKFRLLMKRVIHY